MQPLYITRRFLTIFVASGFAFFIFFYRRDYSTIYSDRNATYSNHCHIPEWNRVKTKSVTASLWSSMSRRLWMSLDLSREGSQNDTELSLIGAYVYPKYISIVINSQAMVKTTVYCRYFDCQRLELQGTSWKSDVFPESVVQCPRRIAADFVSISKESTSEYPTPMRLKYRIFEEPVHQLAICVAPFYGMEPKWMQIAEFIEHHKMEGATFFYFHIGKLSLYDRRILAEYENAGDIEVKTLQDKYKRPFYAWQLIEIQDCHMRSKYHSKWTAFIDIDERIHTSFEANSQKLVNILQQLNQNVAEVQTPSIFIIKDLETPRKFENRQQIRGNLFSRIYNLSTKLTWNASKAIIRPDKIGIMSIHYAIALEPSYKTIKTERVYLRHYKDTLHRVSGSDWATNRTFSHRPLPKEYTDLLAEKVLRKLELVYDKVPVNCSTIAKEMWISREFPNPCERMLLTW